MKPFAAKMFMCFGLFGLLLASGCASSSKPAEMSAKDEARFAAAIEKADAEKPSSIPDDAVYVVAVGESAASTASQESAVEMPTIERSFKVSREAYDAFFAQSPGAVLGRMKLSAIMDGGKLLGYRIISLKRFDGVDLDEQDIITGLDGVMPINPDVYFESWEKAKNASHCTVNVQRGVEKFNLEWTVE